MAEENNYGYYSFNLKKEFKTLEELKEAEAAEKEKVDKEKLALEERKQKAKEVEDAYKEYISLFPYDLQLTRKYICRSILCFKRSLRLVW